MELSISVHLNLFHHCMFVAGSSLKAKLAVFTVCFFSLLCHCMRCISLSLRLLHLGVQLLHVLIGHCASFFEFVTKFPSQLRF